MARNFLQDVTFSFGAKINGLPAAVASGQPVTFDQLNVLIEGNAWKDEVRVAATANINLAAPGATIDGATMASGDRFLATAQTAAPENGVYV